MPKKKRIPIKVIKIPLAVRPTVPKPNFPPLPRLYLELLENKDKIKKECRNTTFEHPNLKLLNQPKSLVKPPPKESQIDPTVYNMDDIAAEDPLGKPDDEIKNDPPGRQGDRLDARDDSRQVDSPVKKIPLRKKVMDEPRPREEPKPRQREEPREEPKPRQMDEPREEPKPRQRDEPREEPKPRAREEPREEPKPRVEPTPKARNEPREEPRDEPKPREEPTPKARNDPREEDPHGRLDNDDNDEDDAPKPIGREPDLKNSSRSNALMRAFAGRPRQTEPSARKLPNITGDNAPRKMLDRFSEEPLDKDSPIVGQIKSIESIRSVAPVKATREPKIDIDRKPTRQILPIKRGTDKIDLDEIRGRKALTEENRSDIDEPLIRRRQFEPRRATEEPRGRQHDDDDHHGRLDDDLDAREDKREDKREKRREDKREDPPGRQGDRREDTRDRGRFDDRDDVDRRRRDDPKEKISKTAEKISKVKSAASSIRSIDAKVMRASRRDKQIEDQLAKILQNNNSANNSPVVPRRQERERERERSPRPEDIVKVPPSLDEIDRGNPKATTGVYRDVEKFNRKEQEEENRVRDLLFKFKNLKKRYSSATVPDFNVHSDPVQMEKTYDNLMRELMLDDTVSNYQKYLKMGLMAVELGVNYFLGFDMSGFTKYQMNNDQYNRLLIEIGEKNYMPTGSSFPVEVRLLGVIILNAAVFVFAKIIANKTGLFILGDNNSSSNSNNNSNNSGVPDIPALSNLFGGGNSNNRRRMRGPNMSVDDIPEIGEPAKKDEPAAPPAAQPQSQPPPEPVQTQQNQIPPPYPPPKPKIKTPEGIKFVSQKLGVSNAKPRLVTSDAGDD